MKDFLFLKFLDFFKRIFSSEIDYESLRKIIQLKILLDSRTTTNSNLQKLSRRKSFRSVNPNKKPRNRNVFTMLLYFVIGFFSSSMMLLPLSISVVMGITITIFMIFIGTKILGVFSTVLINTRDNNILLSRNVNKKTLSLAKAIYAIYYIGLMSISLMIVPLIITGIKYSILSAVLLFIEIIFVNMFLVGIVAVLYYFVLKFFDGEKLKDVVSFVQIILAVFIFAVSHFMYILESFAVRLNNMSFHAWFLITPTYWFSSPFVLLSGDFNVYALIGTALAFIIPLVLISIYLMKLNQFESYIQKLDMVSTKKQKRKFSFASSIGSIICKSKEEKAFYDFSLSIMKNEREFKAKLYPQLVQSLLSPIFLIIVFSTSFKFSQVRHSYFFLAFYLGTASVASFVYMIKYSNSYKGAWIYNVLPYKNEAVAYTGALKAFYIKFILPTSVLIAIIIVAVFGFDRIPDALTIILGTTLAFPISYKYSASALPFSVSLLDRPRGNKGRGYTITLILAVFAGLQFAFDAFIPFGSYILLVLALIATIVTWKLLFKQKNDISLELNKGI